MEFKNLSDLFMLSGNGKLVENTKDCQCEKTEWVLYFTKTDYQYIYECEADYHHDYTLNGKWGDRTPIDKKKDWAFEQAKDMGK